MIYNPTSVKIRELLKPIIVQFIQGEVEKYGKCYETPERDIHKHIKNLKEKDKEKFKLIDFDDHPIAPWSDEITMIIGGMLWGVVKQKDEGLVLTGKWGSDEGQVKQDERVRHHCFWCGSILVPAGDELGFCTACKRRIPLQMRVKHIILEMQSLENEKKRIIESGNKIFSHQTLDEIGKKLDALGKLKVVKEINAEHGQTRNT